MPGRAMDAAKLVLDGTATQAAAGRKMGVSRQAVSQALARIRAADKRRKEQAARARRRQQRRGTRR